MPSGAARIGGDPATLSGAEAVSLSAAHPEPRWRGVL